MKGLLYRNFYLGKKTYILHGMIALAMAIFGVLVGISSHYGNLVNYADNNPGSFENIIKILMYLPIFMLVIAVQGISQNICADYKEGWMIFEYNLPVKDSVKVGAHYIAGLIIVAVGMGWGTLYMLLVSQISGVELVKGDFVKMLLIGLIGLVQIAFFIPVSLRVKTQKAVTTVLVIIICAVWFASFIQLGIVDEAELTMKVTRDIKLFKKIITNYWMIIIPVMLTTSFLCSLKTMKAKRI